MKPIFYLAAFRQGALDLDTPVPDEPISVHTRRPASQWISISTISSKASSRPAGAGGSRETQLPFGLSTDRNRFCLEAARDLGIRTLLHRYELRPSAHPKSPYWSLETLTG